MIIHALKTLIDNPYDTEVIEYINLFNPELADYIVDAQQNQDEDEVIALCREHLTPPSHANL